jgi:hypothetical protein
MTCEDDRKAWSALYAASQHLIDTLFEEEYNLDRVFKRAYDLLFTIAQGRFKGYEIVKQNMMQQLRARCEEEDKRAQADPGYAYEQTSCRRCNQQFQRKDLIHKRLTAGAGPAVYHICRACVQAYEYELTGYFYICVCCGQRYKLEDREYLRTRKIPLPIHTRLCARCLQYPEYIREMKRIDRNLKRARRRDRPAALTFRQWAAALSYFRCRCAYCGEAPYEVMEHYRSIEFGGGTTVENVLPSCKICNSKKRDLPPECVTRLFPAERVKEIQEYFAGLR